ncbi:MAG TPA: flagellar hook-length control protein FliK [Bacillota bacterium]|nr:flagellar hook-length control protein FliK [Bacillota bacterium]
MNVKANSPQPMMTLLANRLEKIQKDLAGRNIGKSNAGSFEQALKGAVKQTGEQEDASQKVHRDRQFHSSGLGTVQGQKSSVVEKVLDNRPQVNEQQAEEDQEYWNGQVMGLLQLLSDLSTQTDDPPLNLDAAASILQTLLETQLQSLGVENPGQLAQQLLILAGILPSLTDENAGISLTGLDQLTGQEVLQLLDGLEQALIKGESAQTGPQITNDLSGGSDGTQDGLNPKLAVIQTLQKLREQYSLAESGTAPESAEAGTPEGFQQSPRFEQLVKELKPLLEQLAKGVITAEDAAGQILAKPSLLELIAQQVRKLQVVESQNASSSDLETLTGQQAQEVQLNPVPQAQTQDSGKKEPGKDDESHSYKDSVALGKGDDFRNAEMPEDRARLVFQLNPMPHGSLNEQLTQETGLAGKQQPGTVYRQLATSLVMNQLIESSQVLVGKDHSEVKIQLKPDFLGKVALQVSVENGVVKAEIAAESQQVKQLIEANLGSLKQHLADQGLKVEQLVVSLGQGQTQSGGEREQSSRSGKSNRRGQTELNVFEVGEISGEYGDHLVDAQTVDYKI